MAARAKRQHVLPRHHKPCVLKEITGGRIPDQYRNMLANVGLRWLMLAEVTKARLQNVTKGYLFVT